MFFCRKKCQTFQVQDTLQPILCRAHEAPHLHRGHFCDGRGALWTHSASGRHHEVKRIPSFTKLDKPWEDMISLCLMENLMKKWWNMDEIDCHMSHRLTFCRMDTVHYQASPSWTTNIAWRNIVHLPVQVPSFSTNCPLWSLKLLLANVVSGWIRYYGVTWTSNPLQRLPVYTALNHEAQARDSLKEK